MSQDALKNHILVVLTSENGPELVKELVRKEVLVIVLEGDPQKEQILDTVYGGKV